MRAIASIAAIVLLTACASAQVVSKDSLTPAQRKITTELLAEIRRQAAAAPGRAGAPETQIKMDDKGRALVDVRADVTPAMEKTITDLEATIVSTSVEFRSIVAWIPLSKLESLAEQESVRSVVPAPQPATHK
jgi:hypothetical protein